MLYDGKNPLHAMQARTRLDVLISGGKLFNLEEKKPRRTNRQNAYLHVALGYFASQVGETLEYVKEQYFKLAANKPIFLCVRDDKFTGRTEYLRSSAELDTAEMTTAIERFRDWAAQVAGIYIPSPNEEALVNAMEAEVSRYGRHI